MLDHNPFYFRTLNADDPFCNRTKELQELTSYAKGRAHVVLYSPRRFGKTSLVRRVQKDLADAGAITIYADFFGVTSIEDVASRLARAVYKVTHQQEGLFSKALKALKSFRPVIRPDEESGIAISVEPATTRLAGMELFADTLEAIGVFIDSTGQLVQIALDEFQEIVELRDALRIEGVMRSYLQNHKASYFFIGSRRRVLAAIFNDRQRPFFQSAINYELDCLPENELASFVSARFAEAGLSCPVEMASQISSQVRCHPYYSQKLAFFVYEVCSAKEIGAITIREGFEAMFQAEKPVFEATIQGLSLQQITLLKALAREETKSLLALDWMGRHRLASIGGTKGAKERLFSLDLIEQVGDKNGVWRVVDPVFAEWLRR